MRRLTALTGILIIGVCGVATEGSAPDDAVPSPAKTARKPAPAPPIKYLEAGSRLFNSGRFELAAKYLAAAHMYRDQLQQDEQSTLDEYLKELSKVERLKTETTSGPSPAPEATTPAAPANPASQLPTASPATQPAPEN
ncbi:MAG TPA: hypothetical protein VJY33_05845, partial [Isosphaeraceae bacterium]|nr:hypothetical protein [Isosphaeraceae bacterium]